MKMHYYNCKLRLHGNVVNEVMKHNLSAPEIIMLRKLHGDDAVLDVKYAYTGKIDAGAERRRLSDRYNDGLKAMDKTLSVLRLFGEEYQPLLNSIKGVKIPEKLVKKSEMKAAALAAAKERADAQDNNVHQIDEDDIDGEDDFDSDFDNENEEEEELEEAAAPAKKAATSGSTKRTATPPKAAGVI